MDVLLWYFMSGVLASLGLTLIIRRRTKKIKRRLWMRPWLRRRDLPAQRTMLHLYKELLIDGDVQEFRATLRMEPEVYNALLELLRPGLTKKHSNFRRPIDAETRLAVTMRYLALGEGFRSLSQQFRIGLSTAIVIVRETCRVIVNTLQARYLKTPNTEQEWFQVADEFYRKLNFPHCLGAIDGKHIRIMAPRSSGTFYYNFKNYFSIVLLAIVNADYEFLYIDCGAEGKSSDGGIWNRCSFNEYLEHPDNPLNIPPPSRIPGMNHRLPYVLVGDDAFRLSTNLMKPFAGVGLSKKGQIFNYRLSRTRRIVENTFGIFTCRFQVFRKTIEVGPDFVQEMVMSCCVLHNYMRYNARHAYLPQVALDNELPDGIVVPGAWRQEVTLEPMRRATQKNASQCAKKLRLQLADYFLTAQGEVDWQYRHSFM